VGAHEFNPNSGILAGRVDGASPAINFAILDADIATFRIRFLNCHAENDAFRIHFSIFNADRHVFRTFLTDSMPTTTFSACLL
jgi:hypothetical protein